MRTRLLIPGVLLGLALWSGWWWIAARGREAALSGWLADRRAAGWVAEAADIAVSGYPSRLDATLTDLALADPATGWAWSAPEFQILSLLWQDDLHILAFPGDQRLSRPGETLTLSAPTLRGSVRFLPGPGLGLSEVRAEGIAPRLASSLGWEAEAASATLALRRAAEGTAPGVGYDLALDLREARLPAALLSRIDPGGILAPVVRTVRLDATLALGTPLDARAVEGATPLLAALAIREAVAEWGDLRLEARGRMRVDEEGRPEGDLAIVARNWRQMLRGAAASGLLWPELARGLEEGLSVLAALSGGGDTLRLPLTFSDGRMSLGPLPLGPAPRLLLRQRQ